MRLTLLGFGLIGGSIALALGKRPDRDWRITAWSRSLEGPRRALARGLVAAVAPDPETAVRDADLVVLAAPPLANLDLLDHLGPGLAGRDVTLSDVSSVQGPIADRAGRIAGLRFVGGHPMSGRERRGFGAATADLFAGRPWVLVPSPGAGPADLQRVRGLAVDCGADPLELEADTHDRAVAAISHLPLVLSVALAEAVVDDPSWPLARRLSAQGWRDNTRLARGDPALGAGILSLNGAEIRRWLTGLVSGLAAWDESLAALSATPTESEERAAAVAALEDRLGRVAAGLEAER
ncbi:MAG TPA: prephenate dehydrogenase/arogenate dehydrogenase family protein [Candidatus Limnocylindrales bacterium]|nr:prephenate dehydrogenase/arogenate dehydrogenase family protein [Candidatus Limnocylindrales bacterium]